MLHGIYVRSKPNKKWLLMSITNSSEAALQDLDKYVQQAKSGGNDMAEGAIKSFESSFFIPETLPNFKPSKVLFN